MISTRVVIKLQSNTINYRNGSIVLLISDVAF